MMKYAKIISIGYAVPPRSYSQREVFDRLGYPRHFWSVFRDSDIDQRHFWLPLGEAHSWQEMCDAYKQGALELSKQAVLSCLDGRDVADIGCITATSCTGYLCPALTYLIARDLHMPSMEHIPIIGDGGCAGAAPALTQAWNYTRLTGKMSLAVSVEVCSTCYYPEDPSPDPRGRWQLLRANAIFGDGAAAVLVGHDENPRHPVIVDQQTYVDTEHIDALGFEWREGRLSCVLSTEVPVLAGQAIAKCVKVLLNRNGLSMGDISHLVCHPGGARVLDNVRDALELPEDMMALSREGLRRWGNCSSASVGMLGTLLMAKEASPKGYGLVISVGSGMSSHAILLRWL